VVHPLRQRGRCPSRCSTATAAPHVRRGLCGVPHRGATACRRDRLVARRAGPIVGGRPCPGLPPHRRRRAWRYRHAHPTGARPPPPVASWARGSHVFATVAAAARCPWRRTCATRAPTGRVTVVGDGVEALLGLSRGAGGIATSRVVGGESGETPQTDTFSVRDLCRRLEGRDRVCFGLNRVGEASWGR